MQLDNHTPYGHVAANARPESRLLVRVNVRDGHMGQMLNDGRSYASGTHTLQIYKSELPALMRLLETREAEYQTSRANLTQYVDAWCADNKRPAAECPITAESQFRALMLRDVLPLTSVEVVGELDTIDIEYERRRATAIAETAALVSSSSGEQTAVLAGIVEALAKISARLDGAPKQGR